MTEPQTMLDYIKGKLAGFYEGSKRLTHEVCKEIADWMADNGYAKPSEFDAALTAFRDRDKKSDFCPVLKQLKGYFPRKQDLGAKYRFFEGCVIRDGWYNAVWSNEWANAMILDMGHDPLTEYSGMETWLIEFCQRLHHDGDPAAAYAYAAENAMPPDVRWKYKKKADYLEGKPLEFQRQYFPFFQREKRQPQSALTVRDDDIVDTEFYPTPKALSEPPF